MTLEHIDPIYGRMDDAEQAIKDIQDLLVHLNADLSETQMFLARSAVWAVPGRGAHAGGKAFRRESRRL